jgi:hypothetical protein
MARKLPKPDAEAAEVKELLQRAGLSSGLVVGHTRPWTRQELRTFLTMARETMPKAGLTPLHAWKTFQDFIRKPGVAPEDADIQRFMVENEPTDPEDLMDRLDLLLGVTALGDVAAVAMIYLTDEDWDILTTLAASPKLLTQEQIEGGIPGRRVAVRTIQKRLPVLEKKDLVCRPEGPRSGWGPTAAGFEAVKVRK